MLPVERSRVGVSEQTLVLSQTVGQVQRLQTVSSGERRVILKMTHLHTALPVRFVHGCQKRGMKNGSDSAGTPCSGFSSQFE